jgi:dTDP-4-dehydrorhamnose reductase
VVADQFGAPTSAALIADVTAQIVARFWLHGDRIAFPGGLYHLAAAGETTWHAYAEEVFRVARLHGEALKVARVEPIGTSAYPLPAPRPANSRLDTTKLRETFDVYLPPWQDGVRQVLDQLLS